MEDQMAEQEEKSTQRRRRRQLGNSTNIDNSNHHRHSDDSAEDSDTTDQQQQQQRRGGEKDNGGDVDDVEAKNGGRRGKTDRNNLNLINVRDEPPQSFDKNNSRTTGKWNTHPILTIIILTDVGLW